MQRSAMLFAASWNQGFAMHIARAYCVEAGKVVDIYQARALFFGQEEPRCRFRFLCSDAISTEG
jgi:hypothetical protein